MAVATKVRTMLSKMRDVILKAAANEAEVEDPPLTPPYSWEPAISVTGDSSTTCPKCGAPMEEWELCDFNPVSHMGYIYCRRCGGYIRMYDAG